MMNSEPTPIPLFDPNPDIEEHREAYYSAVHRVMEHGQFILGPEVEEFEKRTAGYLGRKHAIGVNSGTDALVIALRAAGVGVGEGDEDEVITTPFSFFATAESISNVGARPVFVDIDLKTLNIDPGKIEDAVTENTVAVLPVHLFGNPAEMDPILEIAEKHNLKVIEDCAQSFGATYHGRQTGSLGDAGAFSFFPTKNLGGFGDGGLITTDDDEMAKTCRKLRSHGGLKKYHNEMLGYNSRLDTIQAAVLLEKLNHIDCFNERRLGVAESYNRQLGHLSAVKLPEISEGHVFHQYTLRVMNGKRDKLREYLSSRNISTGIYYPVPQDKLPVYDGCGRKESLEHSELAAGQVLSLPIYPGISQEAVERVAMEVRAFFQDTI